jgi:TRAP-type mannitol/chloroaromatic compound transport system permease small subunit
MYIVLVYGYGLQKGGFVSMDMFSSKWKPKTQKIVSFGAYLIFFLPFCGLLLSTTFEGAISSIGVYEVVDETYWYPAWPLNFAIFIGIFLLFIQGIAEMLRNLVWLVENKRSDKI